MVRAALFSACYYYYYVCVCFCVGVLLECVISQCHTVLLLWELMRWRGQRMLHSTSSVFVRDLQENELERRFL